MNTKSDANQSESELGNVLLQKRGISNISLIIAFVVLLFILIMGIRSPYVNASYTDVILFVAFWLAVFLIPITLKYRRTISIYERGVVLTTVLKKRTLLYKDLAGVRFLIKSGTIGFVPSSVIFAFLPMVDNEVKFAISGSVRTVTEIAQVVISVIHTYPDIQIYGDRMTVKISGLGNKITVEEEKGIVDRKIKF